MVSFNLTGYSDGGSGCIGCPLSRISSKDCLAKVSLFYLSSNVACTDPADSAIGRSEISCAPHEYATVNPPNGQSCNSFLSTYIINFGGYVENPDATSGCHFCAARTTDQFLLTNFNIEYSHHWRNLGIVFGYVFFNVGPSSRTIPLDDLSSLTLFSFRFSPSLLSHIYSASGLAVCWHL